MTTVEKIQSEIKALPPDDYATLRQWFLERDGERWDSELEQDVAAGKLDFLLEEAFTEKARDQLKDL
jgi:hypothetical protein